MYNVHSTVPSTQWNIARHKEAGKSYSIKVSMNRNSKMIQMLATIDNFQAIIIMFKNKKQNRIIMN